MRRILAALLVIAGTSACAAVMDATQLQSLFAEGNGFFRQANDLAATDPEGAKALYQKAILRFERIAEEGGVRNGKLYYDLGNAYFLGGDLGRAILNYHRAKRYLPNDVNLLQNLAYVRSQRSDRIDEPQNTRVLKTLFFWHYDLSVRTRTLLFVPAFLALWLCAVVRLFVRRPGLNAAIALCAVASLSLFGSLAVDAVAQAKDASGVIVAPEVLARKGNGETYQPSFEEPLHAGTELSLVEDRGEWCNIRLRDGRTCWVPAQAMELVGAM